MQRRNYGANSAVATIGRVIPPPHAIYPTRAHGAAILTALFDALRRWHEREQQRRELSTMRQRDFGDVPVSVGAVRDEARRWPWQRSGLR